MWCVCNYKQDGTSKHMFIQTDRYKTSFERREQFEECFSGGRSPHRYDYVQVAPDVDVSSEWGVTIKVTKNETTNLYFAENRRDEDVLVSLEADTANTVVLAQLPLRKRVPAFGSELLLPVHRYGVKEGASFVYKWRAEPYEYAQLESSKQLSSNGVTVAAVHSSFKSTFTVYNDRNKDQDSVFMYVDVVLAPGVSADNVKVSHRVPTQVVVKPGQRKTFLTVQPVDNKKPWGFTWNYRWQSGSSPLEIFGIDS